MNIEKMRKELSIELNTSFKTWKIKDTPAFPLALNVPMPENHELDNADLSFRFHDFSCINEGNNTIKAEKTDKEGFIGLTIGLDKIRISGRYAIDAKYAPVVDLDIGGNMMPLNSRQQRPRSAGADEGTGYFNSTQKEEFEDQAREHRTLLQSDEYKKNGSILLDIYGEHRDTYTEMFQTSSAVRETWQQGNVTSQMVQHTSDTIKAKTQVINPPASEKTFGEGFYAMGYNENAFIQQVSISTACMAKAKHVEGKSPDDLIPDNKYSQAAIAIVQFKGKIGQETGNTPDNTNSMTSDQVYSTVKNTSQDMPKMILEQLNNLNSQTQGDGGRAISEAKEKGWYVLSEEERTFMRTMMDRCYTEFCMASEITSVNLWNGVCRAVIKGTEISVVIDEATGKAHVRQVELPVFDFEMDDSKWQGEAGDIARKRLEQIHFVRSLLHEQIVKSIELSITDAINRINQ